MKKIVTVVAGILFATAAYAACRTHTVTYPDGRMVTCTTCCYSNGNCTTNCF